jgi:hypothetical protein
MIKGIPEFSNRLKRAKVGYFGSVGRILPALRKK